MGASISETVASQIHSSDSKLLSITNRNSDFWLLGGASVLFFLILFGANFFRDHSQLIQQKFILFGPFFVLMSALCNHPHFIISYKFGYLRGFPFIFKHWFALMAVPLGLFIIYAIAFVNFDESISSISSVLLANQFFEQIGLNFRFGETRLLGPELLGLSIWLMYLTVGWHYSKQVYGCLMVYNVFDQYGLSAQQKLWIRYSLLALAWYQFVYLSEIIDSSAEYGYQDQRFSSISLTPVGLPHWLLFLSRLVMGIGFFGTCAIFIQKFYQTKKFPSSVFMITWLSIYVWWIQFAQLPEFYFMAVPFFHSLQYLPFAAKMERGQLPIKRYYLHMTFRILVLLAIGLLAFEFVPQLLDTRLDTLNTKTAWFFVTAFAVFINIHHFFIDSTVWKLGNREIKTHLMS